MSRSTSSRRLAFAAALMAAWIAGSTLGAVPAQRRAAAMPLFQIEAAHTEFVPVLDGSEPIFVLLIGSDARPGEEIAAQRADSVHILAINPERGKATIVGFPRDSYVSIPGVGSNKINSAMPSGGPEKVVETVEELTGITMDYWALTWFEGFEAMIDDVGGLAMDVPFDVFDSFARAEITAGEQVLTGRDALAFARARHALTQFRREFSSDPSRLLTWIGAGLRNGVTDVPFDELMALAFTASALDAKHVVNVVLPGSLGMVGNTSVVNLDQTVLQTISTDLANDGLLKKANVPPSPNADLLPDEAEVTEPE